MTNLAIIGPGLLGGSLALSARRLGYYRVSVWARRAEALGELRDLGIAEHASNDLAEVCAGADLAVLCVPIGAMPELAKKIAPLLPAGALVTDVGSVKAPVVRELSPIFEGRARFVGSHPMAGSEQSGAQAARADLFDGAVCIVTPEQASPPEAVLAIRSFWQEIGCVVRTLAPEEHDDVVAMVSHLPHLIAATLVNSAADANSTALEFCGAGFRDTTRVAAGPPEMWTEIMASNAAALRRSADAMVEKLREFITLLDRASSDSDQRMNDFLTQAKVHRDRLRLPR